MFVYCGNNPVNRADPTGQFWITAFIVTAVVAICAVTLLGCSSQPSTPSNYIKENSTNQNCYSYAFGLLHSANLGDYSANGESDYMFKDKNMYTPAEITEFIERDMLFIFFDEENTLIRIMVSDGFKTKEEFQNQIVKQMAKSDVLNFDSNTILTAISAMGITAHIV